MYYNRRIYTDTINRKKLDKSKLLKELHETSKILTSNYKRHVSEFLKDGKSIIYANYPGISIEQERLLGKIPNVKYSIRAKKDSIGRSCPISIRQHSKNSVYFILDPSKETVIVKCFTCEGFKELTYKSRVFEEMKPHLTISDKEAKKTKTTRYEPLENLNLSQIIKFEHNTLHLDTNFILEFYDLNKFVTVAAKLDKKSPAFSNWTNRSYDDNESINFKYNNVAVVCGKNSGIFVVDVDVNDNGLQYFQQLCSKHMYRYDLETTCVLTPSGGVHIYYIYNDNFQSNTVKMKTVDGKPIGIDIRSNGGCVIAPPSKYMIEDTIREYKFICMRRPQECPSFIYDLVKQCD
jgi:hypothetical protein